MIHIENGSVAAIKICSTLNISIVLASKIMQVAQKSSYTMVYWRNWKAAIRPGVKVDGCILLELLLELCSISCLNDGINSLYPQLCFMYFLL